MGGLSCLLSLAVNFGVLLMVAFSSTTAVAVVFIAIMVGEFVVALVFAFSFARWRDSRLSLAFCVGVAGGLALLFLLLGAAALASP